jgi:hypothetical protein
METVIEGVYREGEIEIIGPSPDVRESRVLITFLGPLDEARREPRYMTRGMFAGGEPIEEEDFEAAEWHGEEEFD